MTAYTYTAMEQALHMAVPRISIEAGNQLIARAEKLIINRENPSDFEKELLVIAGMLRPAERAAYLKAA